MTAKFNPRLQQPQLLTPPPAKTEATPQLIPVTRWHERHPWPSAGGLRHLIFFANTNGFDTVIRRIGRRVLIDEGAFFAWANTRGGAK
jgi:hypothetical protein